MSRYLGLDLSLTGTGICLLDDEDGTSRHEVITLSTKKLRGAERLCTIRDRVDLFLAEQPTLVAIESYAYGAVGKVFELGELGGVIRLAVYERAIPYITVAPVQLKKYATGCASADKKHVVRAAEELLDASKTDLDDNQADALFLAEIARALRTSPSGLTRAQSEVIMRLRSPVPKKKRRRPRRDKYAI